MWLPITVELWLTDVLSMCLHCEQVGTCWVHGSFWHVLKMHLKTSHVPSMYPPVHNAGTLQEHLSTTIQLLLAITLQAHVEVTFQMWRKCYWWSHWMQMLRLHVKCEWNVSGQNIGRTFCQSLECSQHVNIHFHRPSPPVGWHQPLILHPSDEHHPTMTELLCSHLSNPTVPDSYSTPSVGNSPYHLHLLS